MDEFLATLPLPYWVIGYFIGVASGIIFVILHDLFVIRPQRHRDISHYRADIPTARHSRDKGDRS